MDDKIIRQCKRKPLFIRRIGLGILSILIILLFLQISLYIYQKTEDESASIRKEKLLSENDIHFFTDEENVLLTELEKIQADLQIHP